MISDLIITDEVQRNPQTSSIIQADAIDSLGVSPPALVSTGEEGATLYSRFGKLGKFLYTVGAVFAAYEFYCSFNKAKELKKWLQKLKDSAGNN